MLILSHLADSRHFDVAQVYNLICASNVSVQQLLCCEYIYLGRIVT